MNDDGAGDDKPKRRGLFDGPFNDGYPVNAPDSAPNDATATQPIDDDNPSPSSPAGPSVDLSLPVNPAPTDDALARAALFSERDVDAEVAYALELGARLLSGCLKRPILFDAVRGLPDARHILPSDALARAFDVMCALADVAPVTPRGFAERSRQVGNETDDAALDAVTDEILRAPSGTRADLEELIARVQRRRLATLGDRLARFGRMDHARHQVTQLLAEADAEIGAISALGKSAGTNSIAVPLPPRTRPFRDPARWSTTIPALDAAAGGGLAPLSMWTVRGMGGGALALQIGFGLSCLGHVPTRLMSTRRTSDGLSTFYERFVGERGHAQSPPLSLQPVGEIPADALVEEITRAANGGDRLIVVEGIEWVNGFLPAHANALARLPREEECTVVLAGRATSKLEDVYFELQMLSDVHLELTPFGAEGAVFAECTLADAATPTSARLETTPDGFFDGRRPAGGRSQTRRKRSSSSS